MEQVIMRTIFRKVLTCVLHQTIFLVQVQHILSEAMLFDLLFWRRRLVCTDNLLILLSQFYCMVRGAPATYPLFSLREDCTSR